MTAYVYGGSFTGPDSFDASTDVRTNHDKTDVQELLYAEQRVAFAYWYARGYTDKEIGRIVGCNEKRVGEWRNKRNLPNNWFNA